MRRAPSRQLECSGGKRVLAASRRCALARAAAAGQCGRRESSHARRTCITCPRDELTRGDRLAQRDRAPPRVMQETRALEDEEQHLLAELHRLNGDIERTEASLKHEVTPPVQPPVMTPRQMACRPHQPRHSPPHLPPSVPPARLHHLQFARPRRGGDRKNRRAHGRIDACGQRCGEKGAAGKT